MCHVTQYSGVSSSIEHITLWSNEHAKKMLSQCWYNIGPPSKTLAQRKTDIGLVCRDDTEISTQQIQDTEPMLVKCWPDVPDTGPTLKQHCLNVTGVFIYRRTVDV